MNRALLQCLAAAITCGGVAAHAAAAEDPALPIPSDSVATQNVHVEWGATYASWYSFQGLDYSEGSPVFQPSVSANLRGFSFGLWSNVDQSRSELNEVDATFQAEREVGPVTGGLGYAYLRYPNRDWEPTHELIGDLGLDGPLQSSLSVHWDVGAGRGRYWTLGLSREATLHAATASLGAKLYAHEHYYELSGFPALETILSVSTPWSGVVWQPSLSYLWGWENGDYRGDQAIASRWMVSLTCSSP